MGTHARTKLPRSYFPKEFSNTTDRVRLGIMAFLNLSIMFHIYLWHTLKVQKFGHHDTGDLFWLLKYGTVRLGLILAIASLVSTVIFGRFFCGWVCHMGGWQEFGRWIIYTVFRYKPKLLFSRVSRYMPWIMVMVVFYGVFLVWADRGVPTRLNFDISKRPVWEDPEMEATISILLIFTILMPLFFGSRGVCRYACPWAALFRWLNKFSAGAIQKVRECVRCMECSKVCAMGIDVSYEINTFGKVVSDECIKCLRCTQACDTGTIKYGFKTLAPLDSVKPMKVNMTSFVPEMILMACGVGMCMLGRPEEVIGMTAVGMVFGMIFVYLYHFVHGRISEKINNRELKASRVEPCGSSCTKTKKCKPKAALGEVDIVPYANVTVR